MKNFLKVKTSSYKLLAAALIVILLAASAAIYFQIKDEPNDTRELSYEELSEEEQLLYRSQRAFGGVITELKEDKITVFNDTEDESRTFHLSEETRFSRGFLHEPAAIEDLETDMIINVAFNPDTDMAVDVWVSD